MKVNFLKPPSGPGLSGDAKVPVFGSPDCESRVRLETYSVEAKDEDWKTADDGRRYFLNPVTGLRRYMDEPNQVVKFTTIPAP